MILALLLCACKDPPDPKPLPSVNGSTAPWVEWRAPDSPVRGPVALVVDRPGGPIDRLVADPDVTTFLNDRFHPLFETVSARQPAGTIRFYDGCGCPITGALAPEAPGALIDLANAVIVRPEWRACEGQPFPGECKREPAIPGADRAGPGL